MSDFNKFIEEDKPTLVDFFATWCGPCKMQSPIIDELKNKVGDKANVLKVDIDKNRELASRYRVMSIPTIILFRNGEAVWRGVGLQQLDTLVDKVNEQVAQENDK